MRERSRHRRNQRKRDACLELGRYLLLALLALYVLIPIWGIVYLAFDGAVHGWPTDFRVWPKEPTLRVFAEAWSKPAQSQTFPGLLRNSLVVAGSAALLSVALGASMAYAFARLRFPGRRTGLLALLVGAFLPAVALMMPLYIILSIIHLRTSLAGLALVYTAFAMPFCVWNMRAAFQAVPNELEEAAFLDGANRAAAFWHVSLPLALPSIGVAALIAFLIGYSEFAMGWLFVSRAQNITLAMAISGMARGNLESWANLAALAVMMSLPVVVIFIGLQKYLIDRLLLK
jgi:arabinogalactan oligomer / maltooligosaccharide transport system permease protein